MATTNTDSLTTQSTPYTLGGLIGTAVSKGLEYLENYQSGRAETQNIRQQQAALAAGANAQSAAWIKFAVIGGGVLIAALVVFKLVKK